MLKKTAVAFAICFVLLISWGENNKPVFFDYADSYEVYRESNSSSAKMLNAGALEIMFMSGKTGESCQISIEGFDVDRFLEDFNAEVCFVEKTATTLSYYAYSKRIPYRQTVRGKKVNLHVCIGESVVTLGSPIIYGSF